MDLKQAAVVVTPTSFGKDDAAMKAYLEERVGRVIYNTSGKPLKAEEMADLLTQADGLIAGLDEINAQVIEKANRLKVIARYGVGLDNVDLETAKQRGIVVTCTPGANASSVADLTVLFILLLCRPVCEANRMTKKGAWPRHPGLSLESRTVGLYGFGAIGRQVAKKLSGFDCRITAYDICPVKEAVLEGSRVVMMARDELIATADFLSLHIPACDENRDLVNAEFIKKMKNGAFLINTARGELVDEIALADAIRSGKLAGAALDAFKEEPPTKENPLLRLPQVITTPHMGAHAENATNRMGWMALEDCLAVLEGNPPKYPVN